MCGDAMRFRPGVAFAAALVAIFVAWQWLRDRPIMWQEEVLLASGSRLWVERQVQPEHRGRFGSVIGGWRSKGGYLKPLSGSDRPLPGTWIHKLIPMRLDWDEVDNEWYLVVTYYGSAEHHELGRPKSPYFDYRYRRSAWVLLGALPDRRFGLPANLLVSIDGTGEPAQIDSAAKAARDAESRASKEFRSIQRDLDTRGW